MAHAPLSVDSSASPAAACGCLKCLRARGAGSYVGDLFVPAEVTTMLLCPQCGDKNCPRARDCELSCQKVHDAREDLTETPDGTKKKAGVA